MASKSISSSFRALARPGETVKAQTRLLSTKTTTRNPPAPPAATFLRQSPLTSTRRRPSPSSSSSSIPPPPLSRTLLPWTATVRQAHSIPRPPRPPPSGSILAPREPTYELTFTCAPCGTRSAHNVTKQAYHHGSVLITCPSCRNRHVISDHLHIFGDRHVTVEDLMREKGRLVKRGTLGEDGDVEFWDDGSTTVRSERQGEGMDPKPKPRQETAVADGDGDEVEDAPGSTFGKA